MKQTTIIVLIVITLSLTMTGCVAPTGEWKLDGTVKHTENESTSSPYSTPTPDVVYVTPTPKVVYVTQTPEIVYVTQTPTPNPYEDCWNLGNHHICNNEDSTRACLSALLAVEDMSDRYKMVGIAHTTGNYVMVYGVRWTDWGNDFLIFDPSRDDFITLFDEDQSILPLVVVVEYEAVQRYGIDNHAVPEPTVLLPSLKVVYPVETAFDIENRDRRGEICHFVIQLKEDGRVFMNSDCEGQTITGRWVLEFKSVETVETWVYSITAYGDTVPLHLKSDGKAELYLPDAIEYGYWR